MYGVVLYKTSEDPSRQSRNRVLGYWGIGSLSLPKSLHSTQAFPAPRASEGYLTQAPRIGGVYSNLAHWTGFQCMHLFFTIPPHFQLAPATCKFSTERLQIYR